MGFDRIRIPSNYLHGAVEYSRRMGIAVMGFKTCPCDVYHYDGDTVISLSPKPGQPRITRFKWAVREEHYGLR